MVLLALNLILSYCTRANFSFKDKEISQSFQIVWVGEEEDGTVDIKDLEEKLKVKSVVTYSREFRYQSVNFIDEGKCREYK